MASAFAWQARPGKHRRAAAAVFGRRPAHRRPGARLARALFVGDNKPMKIAPLALGLLLALPLHPAAAQVAPSPFEDRLLRLSEILGSLHFLRNLCGEEGDQWRTQMEALLATENPDEERRARFVASFNHGYSTFEATYAFCTESAIEAIQRYMREGADLTSDTALRYGN